MTENETNTPFPEISDGRIRQDTYLSNEDVLDGSQYRDQLNITNSGGDATLKFTNTGTVSVIGVLYSTNSGALNIDNSGSLGLAPDGGSPTRFGSAALLSVNEGTVGSASLNVGNTGSMGGIVMFSPLDSDAWAYVSNSGSISSFVHDHSISEPDRPQDTVPIHGDVFINTGTVEKQIQFGNLSDTYIGTHGRVGGVVRGEYGNDTLIGGAGAETLRGEGDNDYLQGNGGDDVLDGGDGFDTVGLSGVVDDYTFSRNADGSVTAAGTDGQDQLIAIEQVDFLDDNENAIDLEWLVGGNGGGDGTEFHDTPGETQYLTAANGDGVFVINGSSADYGWNNTEDGTGFVVWQKSTGNPDLLWGFTTLRFADGDINLNDDGTGVANEVQDWPDETQYLHGTTDLDRFVIDGASSDYDWAATQDGTGTVVWNKASGSHDILWDFEEISFNDQTVSIASQAPVEYVNIAGTPQYLYGTAGTDRFVIEGNSSDYNNAKTQDGEGIVVWETASGDFDLLYDFEEIGFEDTIEEIA